MCCIQVWGVLYPEVAETRVQIMEETSLIMCAGMLALWMLALYVFIKIAQQNIILCCSRKVLQAHNKAKIYIKFAFLYFFLGRLKYTQNTAWINCSSLCTLPTVY